MTGRVLVLVDGSNVARCAAWRDANADAGTDHDLRRRLVDAASSWAAAEGHEVVVMFDGAGPWRPGQVRISPDLVVHGSGGAEGDELIERAAGRARASRRPHWIVSNDHALRMVAGAGADRVVASDDFAAELRGERRAGADDERGTTTFEAHSGTRLAEAMGGDVLARLERMRRGEPEGHE